MKQGRESVLGGGWAGWPAGGWRVPLGGVPGKRSPPASNSRRPALSFTLPDDQQPTDRQTDRAASSAVPEAGQLRGLGASGRSTRGQTDSPSSTCPQAGSHLFQPQVIYILQLSTAAQSAAHDYFLCLTERGDSPAALLHCSRSQTTAVPWARAVPLLLRSKQLF